MVHVLEVHNLVLVKISSSKQLQNHSLRTIPRTLPHLSISSEAYIIPRYGFSVTNDPRFVFGLELRLIGDVANQPSAPGLTMM